MGNTGLLGTWATVPPTNKSPRQLRICSGDCANSIPDAIADVYAQGLTVGPVSLQIAGCTFTAPYTAADVNCNGKGFPTNNGTNAQGPTFLNYGLSNTVSSDNVVGKVDYSWNERNTLSTMYFFGNNSGTVADAQQIQPQWLTQIHTRAQVFGENWTFAPTSRVGQ